MDVESRAADVRHRLLAIVDAARAEGELRYFKNTIRCHGVTVPKSYAIAREVFRAERGATLDEWTQLGEALLARGWFEEGTVGLHLLVLARPPATERLFTTGERWLGSYVGNWAHCDKLATGLLGPFLIELPELTERLLPWTSADNRWLRRGAAVSLVPPARASLFLELGLRIAEALLDNADDLVQKGYGWMLREYAAKNRENVTAFLERHVANMPRTAFRYAIEKYPPAERKRLMAL